MPAVPVLSARDLGFRHGRGSWLFDGLTLGVAPGELLRVRGGNGAGKSTLLRVLAGAVAHLPQQTGDLPAVGARRLVELLSRRSGRWRPGGRSADPFW